MTAWRNLTAVLLIGYLSMSRSFAYLGIPPLRIFIGEIVLAAFVLLKPRVALGAWATSLLRNSPLSALGLTLLVFFLYGVWQVGRSILGGASVLTTLKYFVFNYYPMYLFLGMWIALHYPYFLRRFIRILALFNGLYGFFYILVLQDSNLAIPGAPIPLFGQPAGSAVAIVGLLCFERNLRAVWPLLVLNIVVTLAIQVRAEWLSLAVGVLAWGFLTRRIGRVALIGMAGLVLLGLIELVGVELTGRSGGVSLAEAVGRVLAPIDTELAEQFSPNAKHHAGTVEWRQKWWRQIWLSAHSTPMIEIFGHGYGFDLFSLAPGEVRVGQAPDIRTPHNVFYYALGYTGWLGVLLFGFLQLCIVSLVWRTYRSRGEVIGIVLWLMGMSTAFFGNFFETPFGAIPFYLLVGMGIAPGLLRTGELGAHSARPQLLSTPRR
jgi:hypothetical protein